MPEEHMMFADLTSVKVDRRGIGPPLGAFKPLTVNRDTRVGCRILAFAFTGLAFSGMRRVFGQESQGLSSSANSLSMASGLRLLVTRTCGITAWVANGLLFAVGLQLLGAVRATGILAIPARAKCLRRIWGPAVAWFTPGVAPLEARVTCVHSITRSGAECGVGARAT